MEEIHYNNLFNYISSKTLPTEEKAKQQVLRQSKNYIIKNSFLYKIDKNNKDSLIRVVKINELNSVLYMFHDDPLGGHFATEPMFNKIRTRYYWPQMYDVAWPRCSYKIHDFCLSHKSLLNKRLIISI